MGLAWVTTGVAWLAVAITRERDELLSGSIARYVVLMVATSICLALSASRPGHVVFGTPLLALPSVRTVPEVGYGGQMVSFALKVFLLATVFGSLAVAGIQRSGRRALPSWILLGIQVVALLAGLGFSGGFRLLPAVQHRAGVLEVRSTLLESGELSYPLVDGSRL